MREAWVNRGIRFLCYGAAGTFTVVDTKLSYQFIYNSIQIASESERREIALAISFGVAVLASAIGGFLSTPWAWKFAHQVPASLAQIDNVAERLSLIVGHTIAAMFTLAIVTTIYGLDLISTAYQISAPNIWARGALTGLVVFGGSGCLLFANIVRQQAKVAKKTSEDFDLQINGYRQSHQTVNTQAQRER